MHKRCSDHLDYESRECEACLSRQRDALRTQLAESERLRESAEARVAVLEALLAEVANSSTHPHRDGPGCWWCIAEAGQPHEPGCKYAAISASGVEVLARGWWEATEAENLDCTLGAVTPTKAYHDAVPCLVIAKQETDHEA